MERFKSMIKKNWIRIWLFTVVLLTVGAYFTYAAYTEVSTVKRVVYTKGSAGDMFSSNCMRPDISSLRLTSREYVVSVCNYDQDNPTTYNPLRITYTLSAELQVNVDDQYYAMGEVLRSRLNNETLYQTYVTGAANYQISKVSDDVSGAVAENGQSFTDANGYKVTFSADMLEPSRSSVDRYKVWVAESDLQAEDPMFYVHVSAVPSVPSSLGRIETRLYGAQLSADNATWEGSLLERDSNTVDYDFYNYVVTGSGEGTVDILWDPEMFGVSKFFFNTSLSGNQFKNQNNQPAVIQPEDANYGAGKHEGKYVGWHKISLLVDSTEKNRYELQLYKTATDSLTGVSYTGENDASKFITCFFTK